VLVVISRALVGARNAIKKLVEFCHLYVTIVVKSYQMRGFVSFAKKIHSESMESVRGLYLRDPLEKQFIG
jgi:signal peptidase I